MAIKINEVLRPRPGLLETIPVNPSFRIFRVGMVVDTIGKSSSRKVFEVHFDNQRYFRPKE